MTALVMLSFIPMQLGAVTGVAPVPMDSTRTVEVTEPNVLISRLDEIKAMDKSNLTSPEKKALRKEVREIKNELKRNSGGIYISVGALLIVIILLILLL